MAKNRVFSRKFTIFFSFQTQISQLSFDLIENGFFSIQRLSISLLMVFGTYGYSRCLRQKVPDTVFWRLSFIILDFLKTRKKKFKLQLAKGRNKSYSLMFAPKATESYCEIQYFSRLFLVSAQSVGKTLSIGIASRSVI